MPMRLAVCVSGRGSNLGVLLQALEGSDLARVALVLSNRSDAPALDRARAAGVPAEVLADYQDPAAWLEPLARHRIDLVILAGYLKLVPAGVVEAFRGRIINIHPALLPEFGGPGMYGRRVHEAVIASGARESGPTVHLVTERYDEGSVLAQARVPVLPDDTPETLGARVLAAEHELLPRAVLAAARAGRPVKLKSAPTARP